MSVSKRVLMDGKEKCEWNRKGEWMREKEGMGERESRM